MGVFQRYVDSIGSPTFMHNALQYILAEVRGDSPLNSRDIGGILKREFGISDREYRRGKRELMSALQEICCFVKGCNDPLEADSDAHVYYADQGQYEIYHNELF